MPGRQGYTVDEARADAREWIKGVTVHDRTRGWRVCCAILEERIAELEAALCELASDDLYLRYGSTWHDVGNLSAGVQAFAREALER